MNSLSVITTFQVHPQSCDSLTICDLGHMTPTQQVILSPHWHKMKTCELLSLNPVRPGSTQKRFLDFNMNTILGLIYYKT